MGNLKCSWVNSMEDSRRSTTTTTTTTLASSTTVLIISNKLNCFITSRSLLSNRSKKARKWWCWWQWWRPNFHQSRISCAARTQMAPNHGHTSRIEWQQFGRDLQGAVHDPSEAEQLNQGNTPCPLHGCMLSACAPDHNCHNSANRCKKKVHNLCYQASDLCAEEEEGTFFCSRACKQQKQAEQAEQNKENTTKIANCLFMISASRLLVLPVSLT